ncbi:heme exporter protein CcmD [Xanthomonas sp. BRIP62411]|uniref:heme exporter protein CcmD n=1 Tax=Xanthomonas sp. BRIP62411 TaxID=2182389 RepID=UPI000F8DD880|nr:heme exporter protein CcmD [Xanthomonas sp. BRIP62411]
MTTLLAMGGYGQYVWTAYAVFVLVLLADLASPWLRRRRLPRELRGQLQRQTPRRPRDVASAVPLEREAP